MNTLTYTGTLQILECGACAIPHAIPEEMHDDRLNNGGNWYCPNGHKLHFITPKFTQLENELTATKAAVDRERAWRQDEQRQREQIERSNAALRGHLTRWRKRVASGVCPVAGCKRHFPNVQAHVAGEHPDWLAQHPDVFENGEGK